MKRVPLRHRTADRSRRGRGVRCRGAATDRALGQRRLVFEPLEERRMLAVLTVNSLADDVIAGDGLVTLREAIEAANADGTTDLMQSGAGPDTIQFSPSLFANGPASILLTMGELLITDAVTLDGPGADLLTIDASGNDLTPDENNADGSRVVNISDGVSEQPFNVSISGLTLTGGDVEGDGGGIQHTNTGMLTVTSATVTGNSATGAGGGIANVAGSLQAVDSTISGNQAALSGGGIHGGGFVSVVGGVISSNSAAQGGGLSGAGGTAVVTGVVIESNTGGGIAHRDGTLSVLSTEIRNNPSGRGVDLEAIDDVLIDGSTISGHVVEGNGAGIRLYGSSEQDHPNNLTIRNSTISGNSVTRFGGGLYSFTFYGNQVTISHSTITNNTADLDGDGDGSGGGVFAFTASLDVTNTIIAGNFAGQLVGEPDADGPAATPAGSAAGEGGSGFPLIAPDLDVLSSALDVAFSLIGDNTGTQLAAAPVGSPDANGNLVGTPGATIDPLLTPLADNGGATRTHALAAGSPAIDAGDPDAQAGVGNTPSFDQRGNPFTRVVGSRLDIGAFEIQEQPNRDPVLIVPGTRNNVEGATLSLPTLVNFTDDDVADTHTALVDWGDGSPVEEVTVTETEGAGVVNGSHVYRDDGTYVVTVTLADNAGGSDDEQFNVVVGNLVPVLTVTDTQLAFAGQLLDLTGLNQTPILGQIIDPGLDDTHRARIDWGDGSAVEILEDDEILKSNGTGLLSAAHVYQTIGIYTVTVRVADDDMSGFNSELIDTGDFVERTFVVNVASITPLVLENGTATLSGAYAISDPDLRYELDVDWDGDGQFDETRALSGGMFSVDHQYLDDDPTGTPSDEVTVHVRLRDSRGRAQTATNTITVSNVSPIVTPAGDQSVVAGATLDLTGAGGRPPLAMFSDVGVQDTHSATIDWGDGNVEPGVVIQSAGGGQVVGSHLYANSGMYTVVVTVEDDDGGGRMASFVVVVEPAPLPGIPPVVDLNGDAPGVDAVFDAFRRSTVQVGTTGRTRVQDPDSDLLARLVIEIDSPAGAAAGALAVNLAEAAARGISVVGQNTSSLTLEAISGAASAADFQAVLETLRYVGGGSTGAATNAAQARVTVTAVDADGLEGQAQAVIQFITGTLDEADASPPPDGPVLPGVDVDTPPGIVLIADRRAGALPDGGTGSGGEELEPTTNFEVPDRLAADERALQRALRLALTRPQSASRDEVIDVVFSLGDVELASLLGIDMGDEPVYHEARKEQVRNQADEIPERPNVASKPEPTLTPAAEPDSRSLTLWSAIAGSGMLWLGGTWWWMDRRRRRLLAKGL